MQLKILILLYVIWRTVAQSLNAQHFTMLERRPKRCQYVKSHSMRVSDCYGLDLKAVPTNLRGDTEILEAAYNRIRELDKTSFTNYRYLKFLYLQENMINHIEDGTFDSLGELEVIDLSSNSLTNVPVQILRLSSLRKLYMNNNRLTSLASFLEAPTSQTLEFISLAICHLQELPSLTAYPFLKELNVSWNELHRITTEDLAPACSLEALDLTGNPHLFHSKQESFTCDCFIVEAWLEDKMIVMPKSSLLNCTTGITGDYQKNFPECTNITESEETTQRYDSCKFIVTTTEQAIETHRAWVIVAIVVSVSLLLITLGLFWCHRRNRRKNKQNKFNPIIINNNSNIESMVRSDDYVSDPETL